MMQSIAGTHDVNVNDGVEVVPPGVALTHAVQENIVSLFEQSYYRYHYLDEVSAKDRYRLVARSKQRVCGFGTVKPVGRFGILSNLVVAPAKRGNGVGTAIECLRSALCLEKDLIPYSSCVTVGAESQWLKLSAGMTPINVKFGYRQGVFSPSDISSAVTFCRFDVPLDEPTVSAVERDPLNKRMRLVNANVAQLEQQLSSAEVRNDVYADVLCRFDVAQELLGHSKLSFQGIDVVPSSGLQGALFQIKNDLFEAARRAPSDFAARPEAILKRALTYVLGRKGRQND